MRFRGLVRAAVDHQAPAATECLEAAANEEMRHAPPKLGALERLDSLHESMLVGALAALPARVARHRVRGVGAYEAAMERRPYLSVGPQTKESRDDKEPRLRSVVRHPRSTGTEHGASKVVIARILVTAGVRMLVHTIRKDGQPVERRLTIHKDTTDERPANVLEHPASVRTVALRVMEERLWCAWLRATERIR